jgi:DNA-directed RNA polymerase specialized sigma24 family protein
MERSSLFSEVSSTGPVETIPCLNHIINACRENDLKAQLYLYKLYYKEMYKISMSIVKDFRLAEDIMREAFLAALDKIGSCSEIVSFDSGLKKIVENHSHNRNLMLKKED